jgi:hypothetical protein
MAVVMPDVSGGFASVNSAVMFVPIGSGFRIMKQQTERDWDESQSTITARQGVRATIRTLATLLLIGGSFWTFFCLVFFVVGPASRTIPVFGPGLLVTVGYLVRATMQNPSETFIRLQFVRGIWALSALVQGTWLAVFGWTLLAEPNDHTLTSPFGITMFAWWSFATGVSVYAFICEPADDFSV